jgi:hypothetical protein
MGGEVLVVAAAHVGDEDIAVDQRVVEPGAERHFYVASKAPWFEITDDLPQHAELPPRPEFPGA